MLRLACLSGTETFRGLFFPLPAVLGCLHTRKDPRPLAPSVSSTDVAFKHLPGVSVDSQCPQVMFADVPEAQLGYPS